MDSNSTLETTPSANLKFDINKYDVDISKAVHTTLVECIKDLPNAWIVRDFDINSVWLYNESRRLGVIISYQIFDGQTWLHLSTSHAKRWPSQNELKEIKLQFFGDRKAIQVFPSKEEYVNDHPNCLHLFTCLGKDPLPDFRVKNDKGILSI